MERVRSLLASKTPVKWLFYGDSITHGALHTFGQRDYTQLFTERVRYEMGRCNDLILNSAISGNSTEHLLSGFDWRAGEFRPHAAFLMIGMNDCSTTRTPRIDPDAFRKNLNQLADRFAAMNTVTVLQTTCPILPGGAPDREGTLPLYMEIIRQVARERTLPLIDHYTWWQQQADRHYFWMSNTFHPNGFGHLVFAHYLFRELGIFDAASRTCRLFHP